MGSKGSNQVQTAQAQSYQPSPQIAAAGTQALSGAQNAASQPFQMPQAPVAGFSPFQQQAFGQTQAMQGMAQPYFNQGQQYLQQSAAPITGAQVANYYNPMAANVTGQMENIFGQQQRNTTGQLTQAAGGVGADRIAVGQSELANQQGLAAGQTYAGLYQQALQAAQQNAQMQAGAGYGISQMGPAAQAASLQGTGALGAAGAQQQQLAQAQMNAPYQQQLAQIAYPFQTSQYLAGITGGLAGAFGGTTSGQGTTTYPTPSALAQGLGIGTAALGAYGAYGGSGKGSSPYSYDNSNVTGSAFTGSTPASWGLGGTGARGGSANAISGYAAGGISPNYGKLVDLASFTDTPASFQGASINPYLANARYALGSNLPTFDDGGAIDQPPPVPGASVPTSGGFSPIPGTTPSPHSVVPYRGPVTSTNRQAQLSLQPHSLTMPRTPTGNEAQTMAELQHALQAAQHMGGSARGGRMASGGNSHTSDYEPDVSEFPEIGSLGSGAEPIPANDLPNTSGQNHPQLNLNPPSGSSGGGKGSGAGSALGTAASLAMMFINRGGAVNPYDLGRGFAPGGSPDENDESAGLNMDIPDTSPYKKHYAPPAEESWLSKIPSVQQEGVPIDLKEGDAERVRQAWGAPREALHQYATTPDLGAGTPATAAINQNPNEDLGNPYAAPAQAASPMGNVPMPQGRPSEAALSDPSAKLPDVYRGGYDSLTKAYGPTVAAGVLANLGVESPGLDPNESHDNGTGIGIAGWRNERRDQLNAFAKSQGLSPTDRRTQFAFLQHDLETNYPDLLKRMQGAKSPQEAAAMFRTEYERPAGTTQGNPLGLGRATQLAGNFSRGDFNVSASASQEAGSPSSPMNASHYMMPRGQMPYPDSTQRDWGQNAARSPWMSLIKAGATMAQTRGPIGSVIGAGIGAGAGELEGQRKELRGEEDINQKAAHLYQLAQQHLDQYSRMTPYQTAMLSKGQQQQVRYIGDDGTEHFGSFDRTSGQILGEDGEPVHASRILRGSSGSEKPLSFKDALTRIQANPMTSSLPLEKQQAEAIKLMGGDPARSGAAPAGTTAAEPAKGIPPPEKRVKGQAYTNDNGVTKTWNGAGWE